MGNSLSRLAPLASICGARKAVLGSHAQGCVREPCTISKCWQEADGSPGLCTLFVLCAGWVVGGHLRSPSHLPEEPAMKIYFRVKESTHIEKVETGAKWQQEASKSRPVMKNEEPHRRGQVGKGTRRACSQRPSGQRVWKASGQEGYSGLC